MTDVVPDLAAYVARYLGTVGSGSWGTEAVADVIAAEQDAQRQMCLVPQVLTDPDDPDSGLVDAYPYDLAEALARRVATNLANRNLPLGVQTQVAEFGSTATRVGGRDREVTRLEAPYRIIPAG